MLRNTRDRVLEALSELSLCDASITRRKKPASSPILRASNTGRKRRRWTLEEDELLREGVAKWGLGQWSLIRTRMGILHRTPMDCKDRWRNLLRAWTVCEQTHALRH